MAHPNEQEEGGVDDGQHAGQGQHHQGDGQGGHGGEGGEQLSRVLILRHQLGIVNYFSKSGKGAKSSTK